MRKVTLSAYDKDTGYVPWEVSHHLHQAAPATIRWTACSTWRS